jgi:DNA-binding MarR family transcriptional regulator/N-acetylglutamate synthase-like GNAT family acetyltransferase
MQRDVVAEAGYLFLGTRMKRLAERMQADAIRIFERNGFPRVQTSSAQILFALEACGAMRVGDIALALGLTQPGVTRTLAGMAEDHLIAIEPDPDDARLKIVSLSQKGAALVALVRRTAWRDIEIAARDISQGLQGGILDQLGALEQRLAATPLTGRRGTDAAPTIVPFSDELAPLFYQLNADWISKMFRMEKTDEEVLSNPRKHIIDRGGDVLFVRAADGGIAGCGAIQPVGKEGEFELTKMAVDESRRGQKLGEVLLVALIQRARQIGVSGLHLLTNTKCEAAIPLYEKMGFYHCPKVMKTYAAKYARANVAMRYPL